MPSGYTPVFRIMHEGNDVTDRFNDRTTQIKVDLSSGGGNSDTCSISVDDRDWRVASPEVGAWLEIYLGYKEVGLAQIGQFEINSVTYAGMPKSITITGTSVGFQSAIKAPAIKEFDNKNLGDILGEIAKKSGGVAPMIDPELASKKVPFLNQITSPLHILHELERRYGAIAKFENGKLIFAKRDSGKSVEGKDLPTLILRPEHLASWQIRHDARGNYSGAKASYWDKDSHVLKWVEEKANQAIHGEGGSSEQEPFRIGRMFNSKEEAEEAAKAQVGALRRSTGEANITLVKGDPWVRDSMRVVVQNTRDGMDGFYVIDTATHTYVKDAGLHTTIMCKPGDPQSFENLSEPQGIGDAAMNTALGGGEGSAAPF